MYSRSMEPIVYVVLGHDVLDTIQGRFIMVEQPLAALQEHGVVVLDEKDFHQLAYQERLVRPTDQVINFFVSEENAEAIYNVVAPENRWCWLIDERATPDGSNAYELRLKHFKQHQVSRAVVVYANPRHLSTLTKAGISYVQMPHCCPPRRPAAAGEERKRQGCHLERRSWRCLPSPHQPGAHPQRERA